MYINISKNLLVKGNQNLLKKTFLEKNSNIYIFEEENEEGENDTFNNLLNRKDSIDEFI